jgi:hypothetical protein
MRNGSQTTRLAAAATNVVVGLLVVLGLAAGIVALLRVDPWGDHESDNAAAAAPIDPALIHYYQLGQIAVPLRQVRALAVGPDDRLYVGGDKAICVFSADGAKQAEFPLDSEPKCLTVAGSDHVAPGRVYIGMEDHVEAFDPTGSRVASWKPLGAKAVLTSLGAAEHDVFVADAGNRIVWHYDPSGALKGRIGAPDKARNILGFIITSSCFDLAVGTDGLLYVVNPVPRRLEAYTFAGDLEFYWGKGSPEVDGFFGFCNPVHFAVLPDGRFVTAEKGVPRIKIYSARGEFECVVAGPEQMRAVVADLAVDHHDRVLALDPVARCVRIFARKDTASGEK